MSFQYIRLLFVYVVQVHNLENCIEDIQRIQNLLHILPGVVLEDCLSELPPSFDNTCSRDTWLCRLFRRFGILPRLRERKVRKLRKKNIRANGGPHMVPIPVSGPESRYVNNKSKPYDIFALFKKNGRKVHVGV